MGRTAVTKPGDGKKTQPSPGRKIGRFFKIWWMLFWRVVLLDLIAFVVLTPEDEAADVEGIYMLIIKWSFPLAAAVSALIVFRFKKNISMFPIIVFFGQKFGWFDDSEKVPVRLAQAAPDRQHQPPSKPMLPPLQRRAAPSEPGHMTGFEPAALQDLALPNTRLMTGTVGGRLSSVAQQSDKVGTPVLAPVNLAKSLGRVGILDKLPTFWGVQETDTRLRPEGGGATDCAVLVNGKVILLYVGNFLQGGVIYRMHNDELVPVDVETDEQVGVGYPASPEPDRIKRHLEAGFERYLGGLPVEAYVVLMPSSAGQGRVRPGTYYPYRIPVVTLQDLMDTLGGLEPADYGDKTFKQASETLTRLTQ